MATSAVWGFWTCVGVRQGQTTDTVGRISKYNSLYYYSDARRQEQALEASFGVGRVLPVSS